LIDVTDFTVNIDVPEDGFTSGSLGLEIQANSLKVVCAMKNGERATNMPYQGGQDIECAGRYG
jgi:hypothetical protein